MKKMLSVTILAFVLMLIATPIGFAGNPPPPPPDPNMKFVGPAVVGTITITPGISGSGIQAMFLGHCSGIQFSIGPNPFGGSFDLVTPESLEGESLGSAGIQIPLDCAPSKGGFESNAIIYNVTHFTKIRNVITAHVVALFLVPK